jgi:hypothetical protein
MALEHLNVTRSQLRLDTVLGALNDGSLENQLKLFLLSCDVNNLSPRRTRDCAKKVGTSVTLCQQLQAAPSYSYFPVETESEELKLSENRLVSELRTIRTGRSNWHDYQRVCKRTVDYRFVPPLLEHYGELTKQAGTHRRDMVYLIRGGLTGFWGYVQSTYLATAVIVNAKNYGDERPQNEVVVVSKYFGAKETR